MPVTITQNDIAHPGKRAEVEAAVCEAMGDRSGEWQVRIEEPRFDPYYIVSIIGPEGFQAKLNFFGPIQQSADNIRLEVAAALPQES
jgi:hypothetical protein